MSFGASLYGAEGQGQDFYANMLKLSQARKQMQQDAQSNNLLGNYLQSVATMPNGAPAPAPGQPSTPSSAPGGIPQPSPAQSGTSSRQRMSLDGLMKYLSDRGVTGEDAYAAASKFMPWLSSQDQEDMNQAKLNMDLQKLFVQYGYDQEKAKEAADRIAAYKDRTSAMRAKGANNEKISGLTHTAQKLTTGRQKLAAQRDDIINRARNAGRPLTAQEQGTIDEIGKRIQTVDGGIMAIRAQQAKLQGVDETDMGDDSMLQDTPDTDYTGGP